MFLLGKIWTRHDCTGRQTDGWTRLFQYTGTPKLCGGYTNMEFAKTAVMPKRNLTSTGKRCLTFDTMLLLFTSYVPYTGDFMYMNNKVIEWIIYCLLIHCNKFIFISLSIYKFSRYSHFRWKDKLFEIFRSSSMQPPLSNC